jgi:hypothetical protein
MICTGMDNNVSARARLCYGGFDSAHRVTISTPRIVISIHRDVNSSYADCSSFFSRSNLVPPGEPTAEKNSDENQNVAEHHGCGEESER